MKKQIERLSPHQNGKVIAVLMAISSLTFLVPFMLLIGLTAPKGMGPSFGIFIVMPFFYLLFGYLGVAASCWIYNKMYKHVGGIEYESTPD